MTVGKMHIDELATEAALVSRLLAAQFPDWADLPIQPVRSAGTDNALYRLGGNLEARARLGPICRADRPALLSNHPSHPGRNSPAGHR